MRARLLWVLSMFATAAVLAFALPLCATTATSRTQQLVLGRTGDADWFAALADAAAASGDTRALEMEAGRYHQLYGDEVFIVDARGATIVNSGMDPASPPVLAALSAARRNQRAAPVAQLAPWGPARVLIARPMGTGVQVNGAVVIQAATAAARADIARSWSLVAAGAAAALALCGAGALAVSRWVLRPLAHLSAAVAELAATLPPPRAGAAGEATIMRRHGGPPEIRAVAAAFDTMALAVVDATDAQRQLVADTAHAMRNPLAALTIRLDSLEPAIPVAAASTFRGATAEVARLTGLLDGLLTLAVAEAGSEPDTGEAAAHCDAVQVIGDRVDAWHTAFEQAGMRLSAPLAADRLEVAVPAGVLAQILDVALSNACRYAGPGTHTRLTAAAGTSTVTVSVTDDGAGVPAGELARLTTRFFRGSTAAAAGSGLGLPIAAALAAARHGTLTVKAAVPHGLSVIVTLPAGEELS